MCVCVCVCVSITFIFKQELLESYSLYTYGLSLRLDFWTDAPESQDILNPLEKGDFDDEILESFIHVIPTTIRHEDHSMGTVIVRSHTI